MSIVTPRVPKTETRGRCIALYPGAFRPPHMAHYAAVQNLLAQPSIDEVVVIIANRCRVIPGTTQALDADVARKVWEIYLDGIDRVRVEIAPHNAVVHALEYFSKVKVEDSLVFCLGETDLEDGDDRFRTLEELSAQTGIHAEVLSAHTGSLPIRATTLRAALAQGDDQQKEFFSALPSHLTRIQQETIWTISQQGMREIGEIFQEKIRLLLDTIPLGSIQELRTTSVGKMDPVFCAQFTNWRRLFLKYAGDTVGTGIFGKRFSPKPRRRLATERRALKWLRTHLSSNVEIPEVVYFEKKTWTLALSEVGQNGTSLRDNLQKGIFNPTIAGKASQFLAECHTISHPVPPLWGDAEADHQHWKKMLARSTTEFTSKEFSQDVRNNLTTLMLASEEASESRFINLDFQPKNILIGKGNIGVIDFEMSSNFGDPAYDLGSFLGHYVYWILASSTDTSWQKAIHSALHAYQHAVGNLWERINLRVVAFIGTMLLNILAREDRSFNRDLADRVMQAGTFLLAQGINQQGEPGQILCETISCYSN